MLLPGLGNQHEHGVVQVPAGHQQQFQRIVERRCIAGAGSHDGGDLAHLVAKQRRLELGLPGVHPVQVPPQGVDLPIVGQVPVRVRQFPVAQGVSAETGMHQGKCADQRFIRQVQVKPRYLVSQQQSFVYDGVAGHAAHVEAVGVLLGQPHAGYGVFNNLADHVELALQLVRVLYPAANPDKHLSDGRTIRICVLAQLATVHRDVPPTQQF